MAVGGWVIPVQFARDERRTADPTGEERSVAPCSAARGARPGHSPPGRPARQCAAPGRDRLAARIAAAGATPDRLGPRRSGARRRSPGRARRRGACEPDPRDGARGTGRSGRGSRARRPRDPGAGPAGDRAPADPALARRAGPRAARRSAVLGGRHCRQPDESRPAQRASGRYARDGAALPAHARRDSREDRRAVRRESSRPLPRDPAADDAADRRPRAHGRRTRRRRGRGHRAGDFGARGGGVVPGSRPGIGAGHRRRRSAARPDHDRRRRGRDPRRGRSLRDEHGRPQRGRGHVRAGGTERTPARPVARHQPARPPSSRHGSSGCSRRPSRKSSRWRC